MSSEVGLCTVQLADFGIRVRRPRIGWQGAACPECAKSKRRANDDALGVELFADGGARWKCHRCMWKGYFLPEDVAVPRRGCPVISAKAPAFEPPEAGQDRIAYSTEHEMFWSRLRHITDTCPVGRYLEARGCSLPSPDADLRYHPTCRHPYERHWRGPAMVGRVTDAVTAAPISFHLTWLATDGAGKAPLKKPRLMARGMAKRGGVIRLGDDADVELGLCLAEGIETALSAVLGFGLSVWACMDAANMAAFPLLEGVEALTLVADNDPPDRRGRHAGQAAAEECARRWSEAGREIRVWISTHEGTDLNDLARAVA